LVEFVSPRLQRLTAPLIGDLSHLDDVDGDVSGLISCVELGNEHASAFALDSFTEEGYVVEDSVG
jgi:hypothetical protein